MEFCRTVEQKVCPRREFVISFPQDENQGQPGQRTKFQGGISKGKLVPSQGSSPVQETIRIGPIRFGQLGKGKLVSPAPEEVMPPAQVLRPDEASRSSNFPGTPQVPDDGENEKVSMFREEAFGSRVQPPDLTPLRTYSKAKAQRLDHIGRTIGIIGHCRGAGNIMGSEAGELLPSLLLSRMHSTYYQCPEERGNKWDYGRPRMA
jgi:hypothetical protein